RSRTAARLPTGNALPSKIVPVVALEASSNRTEYITAPTVNVVSVVFAPAPEAFWLTPVNSVPAAGPDVGRAAATAFGAMPSAKFVTPATAAGSTSSGVPATARSPASGRLNPAP